MSLEFKIEKMYCPSCLNISDFNYISLKLDKGNIICYYYCKSCHDTIHERSIYSFDKAWREMINKNDK